MIVIEYLLANLKQPEHFIYKKEAKFWSRRIRSYSVAIFLYIGIFEATQITDAGPGRVREELLLCHRRHSVPGMPDDDI